MFCIDYEVILLELNLLLIKKMYALFRCTKMG